MRMPAEVDWTIRLFDLAQRPSRAIGVLTVGLAILMGAPAQAHAAHRVAATSYDCSQSPCQESLVFPDLDGAPSLAFQNVGPVSDVAVAPDGQTAAYNDGYNNLDVIALDGSGSELMHSAPPNALNVAYLNYTPDGNYVLASVLDSATYEWDMWRYSLRSQEWEVVDNAPRDQFHETMSADGTHTAYIQASSDDDDPAGYEVVVANADGSDPQVLDTAGVADALGGPVSFFDAAISPDGSKVAFDPQAADYSAGSDLWTVTTDGSVLHRVTDTPNDWETVAGWSADSSNVIYSNGGAFSVPATGGTSQAIDPLNAAGISPISVQQTRTTGQIDYNGLLERMRPKLAYDSQEIYRADSNRELTDAPLDTLHSADNSLIADHNASGLPDLTRDLLGTRTASVNEGEYIDEGYDDYANEAELLEGAGYADRIYGRVVPSAAPGDHTWLQYWFWYFYDDSPATDIGNHEGDWEMAQIGLDENGAPDVVTLAQHRDAVSCSWSQLTHFVSGQGAEAATLFPADGTHATYPQAGNYPGSLSTHPFADVVDGLGPNVTPALEQVTTDTPWINWPGFWGGTRDGGIPGYANSPKSPSLQGTKWSDPESFNDTAGACSSPDFSRLRATRVDGRETSGATVQPAPPIVRATAGHGQLKVRVAVRTAGSAEAEISFGKGRHRTARRVAVNHGVATLIMSAKRGTAPHTVTVDVRAASGLRSAPRIILVNHAASSGRLVPPHARRTTGPRCVVARHLVATRLRAHEPSSAALRDRAFHSQRSNRRGLIRRLAP
jgi:hypothetical protein